MKKNLSLIVFFLFSFTAFAAETVSTESVQAVQNRGLFAFITGNYVQVSWRMRATDDANTTKYLLYAGDKSGQETTLLGTYTTKTTARLAAGTYKNKYFKVVVMDAAGNTIDTQGGVCVKDHPYLDIPLTAPVIKDEVADTALIRYTPQDCSAYDMDGDGEQEIILKWNNESREKIANGKKYEANEFIDCYKLDGTRLWRIDMGQNCNVGNNVAFFCWDFDGDGVGEIMLKTAPGTKDSKGHYVGGAAHSATGKDLPGYGDTLKIYYRGSDYVVTAEYDEHGNQTNQEWVTVFNGKTGEELGSRLYWPYFSIHTNWKTDGGTDGASYGRRGCSQKGGVMKIPCCDGVTRPTACFQRGAYTYVYCTDFSWDGKTLKEEWRCASEAKTNTNITTPTKDNFCSYTVNYNADGTVADTTYQSISLFSEGAHPSEVADLDGDGFDELCIGAAALDHNGKVLWSTGLGHGDAVHVGELNPQNPGLEVFRITEGATTYDACMLDAKTGKVINGQKYTSGDVGRGIAMDVDDTYPGNEYFYMTSGSIFDCNGNAVLKKNMTNNGNPNYRIYWDGDLLDEHLSATKVSKYNVASQAFGRLNTFSSNTGATVYHCTSINGTKGNPCLQCDLFGDWREELVYYVRPDSDPEAFAGKDADYLLRVITTHYNTDYKLPWLRDDNTYNMEIACQNIGYSMPPHLGYNPVIYYEGYNKTFGNDEVVNTPTTWTFDGSDFVVPSKDTTVVCNNKLYGQGTHGSANRSWSQVASSMKVSFSDGTNVSITKSLQIYTGNDNPKLNATTTANQSGINCYLSFNAKSAGTIYVKVWTYKNTGTHKIFFNGECVDSLKDLATGDGMQEMKYTSSEAGTFFFVTSNYCRVYAIRFVPTATYVKTNDKGYATLTNTGLKALRVPSTVGVYSMSSGSAYPDVANLTAVSVIGKGKVALIKGVANKEYRFNFEDDAQSDVPSSNMLTAVTADIQPTPSTGNKNNFYLSGNVFIPCTDTTRIAAGEAYLSVPTTDALSQNQQIMMVSFVPEEGMRYNIISKGYYLNSKTNDNGTLAACAYPYWVQFVNNGTNVYKLKIADDAYLANNGNTGFKWSYTGSDYTLSMNADGTVKIKATDTQYLQQRPNYLGQIIRAVDATGFTIEEASQETMFMEVDGTQQFSTYCVPYDVAIPSGVKVYTTALNDDTIELTELTGSIIPANKPVLLYAANGYDQTEVGGYARYPYSGLCYDGALTGVLRSESEALADTDYVFRLNDSAMSFCKVGDTGATASKYQAYVAGSTAKVAGSLSYDILKLSVNPFPVAINPTPMTTSASGSTFVIGIYDVSGRKHVSLEKGLNILRFSDGTSRKIHIK